MSQSTNQLPVHATRAGTERYAGRFDSLDSAHFKPRFGLQMSSIGLGTYLGETDGVSSENYVESIKRAVRKGINVLDTAVNYRWMQSERDMGAALRELFASGQARRDEVIISTKGGFVAHDGAPPADPVADLRRRFVAPGLATLDDFAGGVHSLAPDFLSHQIETSLANLGLASLDVYFLHNPEIQLDHVSPAVFLARMRAAFARLEEEVQAGRIRAYGVATWEGLRADETARHYLPLFKLVELAQEAGGPAHRFRFLQFPYNLAMTEAVAKSNQFVQPTPENGLTQRAKMPLLAAAVQHGMVAFTSASLAQGRVLSRIPDAIKSGLGMLESDAQYALHFCRSTPGVTTALVGMGKPGHVDENMGVAHHPPLDGERFFALLRTAQG